MNVKSIKYVRNFKNYRIVKYVVDGSPYNGPDVEMTSAFSLPNLEYIGDSKSAYRLNKRGISQFQSLKPRKPPVFTTPEKASHLLIDRLMQEYSFSPTCCIGFNEKEQKWYGWSHRAIYGFGIGSVVKKGDCAYIPTNPQDMLNDMISFWINPEDEFCYKTEIVKTEIGVPDPNGERDGLGCYLECSSMRKNDKSIFTGKYWQPFLDPWGRGEWEARTLEDAKQMAIDFAEGVS